MKIERKSLMNNPLGFIGACMASAAGISCVYIIDDHISVLERNDGTFSFLDHTTGKEPAEKIRQQIIKKLAHNVKKSHKTERKVSR